MDPAKYKNATVRRSHTYHYYHSPALAGKPTLFFIHGFPSTSFDWSRQVAHFEPLGYGILVPDCLGYGGTSKPTDWAEFRHKLLADDLVDLIDAECLSDVVGIGHDWGSAVLSALAHHHQARFRAFVWLVVGYTPPSTQPFDLDAVCAMLKQTAGSEFMGYWKLMVAPHGPKLMEEKMDSFVQLVYPTDPGLWVENLCPTGALERWLTDDRQPGRATWMSEEEYKRIRNALLAGGMASPVSYYAVFVNNGNLADHEAIPEDAWYIRKPVLCFWAPRGGSPGKGTMAKYAPHAKIIDLDVGHWPQMEATEEVNREFERWLLELPAITTETA
ncbi:alpha/beta-hydrolase [Epithele typhae]|uniref:alpha/beta-hydrolase n=1 Tax=Epithele typhae TaxID=378194 RepID=UPI00200810F4|nr:alpha/beta-hydrolase [Epithele typhae]KAH9940084.1 alpha/beta-hydrolase [Epithele typhae]